MGALGGDVAHFGEFVVRVYVRTYVCMYVCMYYVCTWMYGVRVWSPSTVPLKKSETQSRK